jgi:hypothetical protein
VDGVAAAVPRAEAALRSVLVLAVVALAAGVAGGWLLWERSDEADDEAAASIWNTCTNPVQGYAIDYPAGWHTVHREPASACRSFDPRPFDLGFREGTPAKALAVFLGGDFDEKVESSTNERDVEVLQRDEVDLAAGRAVRLEVRDRTGSEFGGPWISYLYIVEHGREAVVVQTYSSPGVDYEPWKRVVDRAVRTLRFTTRHDVVGVDVPPPPQGLPLPDPVIRNRAEIWSAARRKDYEALERLIDDEGFEYTFGGPFPGGPTAYWRSIEQREQPLDVLAAILELPHTYMPEPKIYVWPDAFSRKPATLTTAEKAELAEAIGEQGVTAYEELDSYFGYRAGIDLDGDWVFYVAGD